MSGEAQLHRVLGALRDVEAVGLEPVRLVHGDRVTLADIAHRSAGPGRRSGCGCSGAPGLEASLRPRASAPILLYSWVEVAIWLRERLNLDIQEPETGLAVAETVMRWSGCGG